MLFRNLHDNEIGSTSDVRRKWICQIPGIQPTRPQLNMNTLSFLAVLLAAAQASAIGMWGQCGVGFPSVSAKLTLNINYSIKRESSTRDLRFAIQV